MHLQVETYYILQFDCLLKTYTQKSAFFNATYPYIPVYCSRGKYVRRYYYFSSVYCNDFHFFVRCLGTSRTRKQISLCFVHFYTSPVLPKLRISAFIDKEKNNGIFARRRHPSERYNIIIIICFVLTLCALYKQVYIGTLFVCNL